MIITESYLKRCGVLSVLMLFLLLAWGGIFHQAADADGPASKVRKNSSIANRSENPGKALPSLSKDPDSSHKDAPPDASGPASQNTFPELGLKLVGTIMGNGNNTYAIIEDETGFHDKYHAGESVQGATVLKIERDGVVLEKEGREYTLGFSGGSSGAPFHPDKGTGSRPDDSMESMNEPPSIDPSEEESGPPHDDSIPVQDLPFFEPVSSETGPPVDPEDEQIPLPEFEPVESEDGPPAVPGHGWYPGNPQDKTVSGRKMIPDEIITNNSSPVRDFGTYPEVLPEIELPAISDPPPLYSSPMTGEESPGAAAEEPPPYHSTAGAITDSCFQCHIYP